MFAKSAPEAHAMGRRQSVTKIRSPCTVSCPFRTPQQATPCLWTKVGGDEEAFCPSTA